MLVKVTLLSLLATVAAASHPVPIDEHIPCYPASTTLNLRFDISAYGRGSTGHSMRVAGDGSWPTMAGAWNIDGCKGINPELHLNSTQEYTFLQHDISNWYHPLVFLLKTQSHTLENKPEFTSHWKGDKEIAWPWGQEFKTSLHSFPTDTYSSKLLYVNPGEPLKEIYYACQFHFGFTGKIIFDDQTGPSTPLAEDTVVDKSAGGTRTHFDDMCGTMTVGQYENDPACNGKHFLCGDEGIPDFNRCLNVIDCKMHKKMAVKASANPVQTFMHQMIAHHENAIEMAKSLVKFADKDDMFHGPRSKKQVKDLATTIINVQSSQVAEMVLYLYGLSNDFPCVTQYTNEYGAPDLTAPGFPFCSAPGYGFGEVVGTACYCRDCSSASARTRKLLFGSIGEPDELPCC